ncbi:ribosome maturation factor RimP [Eubacteriales bacterium KG127]
MSRKIENLVVNLLNDYLKGEDLTLWDFTMNKEGRNHVLRIFIDKEEGYIGTDDCEKVSKYLSKMLDAYEAEMPSSYYLEVSSPGMDRELKTQEQLDKYIGQMVDIKLYSGIDGMKVFQGKLEGATPAEIKLLAFIPENKTIKEVPYTFKKDKIAKINLAVIF